MSILNVNTIQPIGSGTTVTVAATELKTSNFITVGTGASVTSPSANVLTLGTNTAERFRITSAGSIGIGTDNPGTKLDVRGGNWSNGDIVVGQTGNAGRVKFRRGADGSDSAFIGFAAADNNSRLSIGVDSGDGTIAFQTNSAERLRIDSSGRLLIGRTSTSHEHPLQVQAASGANAIAIQGRSVDDQSEITFYENDNSTITAQIQQLVNRSIFRHRVGYLRFDSGGVTEKMRLDSSGRLGLGVVPEAFHSNNKAVIRGDSGYAILGRGDNSLNISQNFYYNSSDAGKYIANGEASLYNQSDGQHAFYSAVSGSANASASMVERLRIGSGGNLALGGQNTSAYSGHTNLFLGGIANLYAETTAASTGSLSVSNNAYINSSGNWVYRVNGKASNVYQYDGGYGFRTAGTGSAGGTISWTERFSITNAGHVKRPTMAAVAVTLSAGQTTLTTFNTSYQTLSLNSEGYDNANNFNTTNYRFTAPETGFYQVGCNVQLENGSGTQTNSWMYLYPVINGNAPGTAVGGNQADFDPTDTHYYNWTYTTLLKLSQNDYVEWKYKGNLTSINLKGGGESIFYFYQVG